MPDSRLILHVKGTEQTTELPRAVVRAAISQGQITHSQLIWSTVDNAWKQVRELPHLWPSQKLAPAPTPRVATGALPKIATGALPKIATGGLPKIAADQNKTGPVPRVAVKASAGAPAVKVAVGGSVSARKSHVIEEDEESHPLKWVSIALGVFILATVAANYFLVDQPLSSRLGQTPYATVTTYAHLGAFMQPNSLVIHVPATHALNNGNLISFLVALAHSTPQAPFTGNIFERVAFTPGWTAHYSISGYAWKQLGDMAQDDDDQRKEFILTQLGDAAGQPLISGGSTLNEEAQQAKRDKIWAEFASQFIQP